MFKATPTISTLFDNSDNCQQVKPGEIWYQIKTTRRPRGQNLNRARRWTSAKIDRNLPPVKACRFSFGQRSQDLRHLLLGKSKSAFLVKTSKDTDDVFKNATATEPLRRTGREVHYPSQVDVKDPFILLVHQGMVEDIFIDDMRERGIEVQRSSPFTHYTAEADIHEPIKAFFQDKKSGSVQSVQTHYLVGCDGAHSNVRKSIPGAQMVGESSNSKWGVLDGKSTCSQQIPLD